MILSYSLHLKRREESAVKKVPRRFFAMGHLPGASFFVAVSGFSSFPLR